MTRSYKTFLATSRLISGKIRVVIVRFEEGGWAPYFCTDTSAEVSDILETVAARWANEEHFHDVKEVWGPPAPTRELWTTTKMGLANRRKKGTLIRASPIDAAIEMIGNRSEFSLRAKI